MPGYQTYGGYVRRRRLPGRSRVLWLVVPLLALVGGVAALMVRGWLYQQALVAMPRATEAVDGNAYGEIMALAPRLPTQAQIDAVPAVRGSTTLTTCGLRQAKANQPLIAPLLALRSRPILVPAKATRNDQDTLDRVLGIIGLDSMRWAGENQPARAADQALALVEFSLRLMATPDVNVEVATLNKGFSTLSDVAPRLDAPTAQRIVKRLDQIIGAMPGPSERMRQAAPRLAMAEMEFLSGTARPAEGQLSRRQRRATSSPVVPVLVLASLGCRPSVAIHHKQLLAKHEALSKELAKPYDRHVPLDGATEFGLRQQDRREDLFRSLALQRLLLAQVAVNAYRAEHGVYPARIEDVCPSYLRHVPRDPFTDKPLGYARDGAKYRCWSVGPDGRDDNGMLRLNMWSMVHGHFTGIRRNALGDLVVPITRPSQT